MEKKTKKLTKETKPTHPETEAKPKAETRRKTKETTLKVVERSEPQVTQSEIERPAESPAKRSRIESKATGVKKGGTEFCQIKSCKRPHRAKGYCRVHYKKWRLGKYGHKRYKLCSEHECRLPMAMNHHGYCEEHFQKYYVEKVSVPKTTYAESLDDRSLKRAGL